MKILLLHNRYRQSGGEDVAVRAETDLLLRHGHEVRLVEADNGEIQGVYRRLKTAFETVYSPGSRKRVASEIALFRPDVVHVHNFFPLLSPAVYYSCREANVPVVQTLHNYRLLCPNSLFFRDGHVCEECVGRAFAWPAIVHACYRESRAGTASIAAMQATHRIGGTWHECVDAYIALTEFSRSVFVRGGLPADKITVKPNFAPRQGPAGEGRGRYALFVGRLFAEKGVTVLLEAWKRLAGRLPVWIVGDGPQVERVRHDAKDPGILCLGSRTREQIAHLMREASFLVLPSLCYENFPLVIVEAFEAGLPVIASDLGSPGSLVKHGRTGLLFRPGDPEALAAQVHWALEHPAEMSRMRLHARTEYEEKYTPERNYERLLEIYDCLVRVKARKRVASPVSMRRAAAVAFTSCDGGPENPAIVHALGPEKSAETNLNSPKLSGTIKELPMNSRKAQVRVLVTGAGGFIGHHLVRRLKADGLFVRGADLKHPEYAPTDADEFLCVDLRNYEACRDATRGIDQVYNLAADMGGIGYITSSHAEIARNNTLINAHMLEAGRQNGVQRFLFSSSACVYAQSKQKSADVTPLREEDAYPAEPEPGYGWEKLYAEELCKYYRQDYGFDTRMVRFHNVYGPLGTYDGGKEKSPAALCRKVAQAVDGDEVEIWGDGEQTRSYMYVDDCVEGLIRLMASTHTDALNLGTDRMVTINELFAIICKIAGKKLRARHDLSKPQGVRGRNSDNTRLRRVLGWEPSTPLEQGLRVTYHWIEEEMRHAGRIPALTGANA